MHWVDHYRDIHLHPCTDHVVTILLVLVNVYDLGLWLLRESLPPCYKKLKNDNFTKILNATTKEFEFCKF